MKTLYTFLIAKACSKLNIIPIQNSTYSPQLGTAMRHLRHLENLTLKQLSKRMNISITYLAYLETNHRKWNYNLIQKFMEALY